MVPETLRGNHGDGVPGWGVATRSRGMREVLPHADLFAPAHTLESLARLEPYLAKL